MDSPELKFVRGIAGLILLIVLLDVINRSRIGHVVIYYSLVLIITMIILTQSNYIAQAFGNITSLYGK